MNTLSFFKHVDDLLLCHCPSNVKLCNHSCIFNFVNAPAGSCASLVNRSIFHVGSACFNGGASA